MKTKVCLACLPFYNHVFSPPIQLAYLKSYLQQSSLLEVKALDLEAYCFRSAAINGYVDLYWDKTINPEVNLDETMRRVLDEMVALILAEDPAIMGFSTYSCNMLFTRYVTGRLKALKPEIFIVYGGLSYCFRSDPTKYAAGFHRTYPDVDCIVTNEGEAALLDVAESFARGLRPPMCKGTTVRSGDTVVDCGARDFIADVDAIPFPDFSDFRKEDYLGDFIRIMFNRGCVGRCVFCSDNYFSTARCRSAANIIEEIRVRIKQGYRRFQTVDLSINPDVRRLEETCEFIIREKLGVEFIFSQFRHSHRLTRRTFALLREAGFRTVSFGTESGSTRILELMRKGCDRFVAQRNIRDAHAEGLSVIVFLMVGFPGETEETFRESLDWITANAEYIDAVKHISPVTVNYGSSLYENAQTYGLELSSLGKTFDSWRTRDNRNTHAWRFELFERMSRHVRACGIPIVTFEHGNIVAPGKSTVAKPDEDRKRAVRQEEAVHMGARIVLSQAPLKTDRYMSFTVRFENTGDRPWEPSGDRSVCAGYRLCVHQGSAAFEECRKRLPRRIDPGMHFVTIFYVERMLLERHEKIDAKFDLVCAEYFWFEDIGSAPLVVEIDY